MSCLSPLTSFSSPINDALIPLIADPIALNVSPCSASSIDNFCPKDGLLADFGSLLLTSVCIFLFKALSAFTGATLFRDLVADVNLDSLITGPKSDF